MVGWEGEGVHDLVVEVAFDPPVAALDMGILARQSLRAIGIAEVAASANTLTFDLEGSGLATSYTQVGRCYTGARVNGTVTLAAPGRPGVEARLTGEVPPADVVFTCERDEDYAPFDDAFEKGLLGVVAEIWGPASAPLLIEVVAREIGTSRIDLALKAVAMDEFRALDPAALRFEQKAAMLRAAVDVVAYLVETGYTPYGADRAARLLLSAYSGSDFGAATEDDVGQWRAWLDEWVEAGGA